jgi:hypothetical protein
MQVLSPHFSHASCHSCMLFTPAPGLSTARAATSPPTPPETANFAIAENRATASLLQFKVSCPF